MKLPGSIFQQYPQDYWKKTTLFTIQDPVIGPNVYWATAFGEQDPRVVTAVDGSPQYSLGDRIPGGFVNGDPQQPFLYNVRAGTYPSNQVGGTYVHWPMLHQGPGRLSLSDSDPMVFGLSTDPFVMNLIDTAALRASVGYMFQGATVLDAPVLRLLNVDDRSGDLLADPPDSRPFVEFVWDDETAKLFLLSDTGALGFYYLQEVPVHLADAFTAGATFGEGYYLEPTMNPSLTRGGGTDMWVVDSSGYDTWTWKQVDKTDAILVQREATSTFDNWTLASELPNSKIVDGVPQAGFPIFFYDGPFSYQFSSGRGIRPPANIITDLSKYLGQWDNTVNYQIGDVVTSEGLYWVATRGNNKAHVPSISITWWLKIPTPPDKIGWYVIPAGPTFDFLADTLAEEEDYKEAELETPRNYGRIMARSQLTGLDLHGTGNIITKRWAFNGWGDDVKKIHGGPNSYAGFTPLLNGNNSILSHFERSDFVPTQISFVTFQADVRDFINGLPSNDENGFGPLQWFPAAPSPACYWREDYIMKRIKDIFPSLVPTFSAPITRDVQKRVTHGLVSHDANTGALTGIVEFGNTTTVKQYYDIGNPSCTIHNEDMGALEPQLMANPKSTTMLVGVDTTGGKTLRQIANLKPDQRITAYMAIEYLHGDTWRAWYRSYFYNFGNGLDSRTTGVPVFYPDHVGFSGVPYIYAVTNTLMEVSKPNIFTGGDDGDLFGNAGEDFDAVDGIHDFMRGHAQYCLDFDSENGIIYLDNPVSFSDFEDPLHRFSRHTDRVKYYFWVFSVVPVTCDVSELLYGTDYYNAVGDGDRAFFLPRCLQDPPDFWSDWQVFKNNKPGAPSADRTAVTNSNSRANFWLRPPDAIIPTLSARSILDPATRYWDLTWADLKTMNCAPVAACWGSYLYLFMSYIDTGDAPHGNLYKINGNDGTIISTIPLPVPVAAGGWTHADLIVTSGLVDVGGDGGLVGVPFVTVYKPDGTRLTFADFDAASLNAAISANSDVVANKAAQHVQRHTFESHTDIASHDLPPVNSVLIWNAGTGKWDTVPTSTVLSDAPKSVNEGNF